MRIGESVFSYVAEDLRRYFVLGDCTNLFGKIKLIVLTQGIWAILVYRTGSWCVNRKKRFNFLIRLVLPFITICQKVIEICTGISLPFTTKVGKGLYIGHFGGIIIGHKVILGKYCNVSQGVTIGQSGRGGIQSSPIIGDRVYIGPGAKVFGGIKIGNDVGIGSNSVVTKDIPDRGVAVGIPARVISYNGSKDFIII